MKKQKDIIKSPFYWFEKIQNELFSQLHDYMKENNKSQSDIAKEMNVTKGYISQILNGNFNPTLKKLIEFIIFLKKVPDINFLTIEEYLEKINYTPKEQVKGYFIGLEFRNIQLLSKWITIECKKEDPSCLKDYHFTNKIDLLTYKKELTKGTKGHLYFDVPLAMKKKSLVNVSKN